MVGDATDRASTVRCQVPHRPLPAPGQAIGLGMLPAEAAAELLDRADLTNEYVPVQAEDGQPRHCGGCGAEFHALPSATAIICEGCGRRIDLGGAEIPCAACGAVMTLPAGADRVACPFCGAQVERSGIR